MFRTTPGLGIGRLARLCLAAGCWQALPPARVADAAGAAPAKAPVVIETIEPGDFPVGIDAVGHVEALRSVRLRPQVTGQLLSASFQEGKPVREGQVLAQIDPRTLQATVAQDQATVAQDRAAQSNAEAILARSKPLLAKGLVSVQDIQSQRAQVAGLAAKGLADQAVLDRDRVQLGFTTVTSPIDGVAGLLLVSVGNVVAPQDGLVMVTQIQPIGTLFPIPGADLPAVQQAIQQAGAGGLSVEAWSQSGSDKLATGRLSAIDNEVEPTTGTVTARALFANAAGRLWPGEFVNIRLILAVRHDATTVPLDAVERGPAGAFVWTLAPDGKARQTGIQVAASRAGRAYVSHGLQDGDRVVTNGQYGLVNGSPTEIVQVGAATRGKPLRNTGDDQLGILP